MEIPVFAAVAAPVIMGVVAVIGQTQMLHARFNGLLALLLGVAGGASWSLWIEPETAVPVGVLNGVVAGLAASGLWSTTKSGVVEPMMERQVE